jgi:PST family polysaccharide transporter
VKLLNKTNLSTEGKLVFKNFSFFSVLRVFNILSQYLLVSYLIRTLGTETYGVFVWGFSIIQYLIIVINFGFNTYAAKYIAENKDDQLELNRIFSAILVIKLSLFILSVVAFIAIIYSVGMFDANQSLFLILLGFVLGEVLFPIWFFQGKEKLDIPTKIVFSFKLLLIALTFLLITGPDDLLRYALLLSGSQLLIGVTGFYVALNKLNISLVKTTSNFIWKKIKEGFMFFIGTLCSRSFNLAVIFLAGIWFTMEDAASFDVSFKIIAAFQLPFETLSMVLFPTISRTKDLKMNERIIFMASAFSLLLWGFTFWQSDMLLMIMGGKELLIYSSLLKDLSVLIPIVVITYFLGTNTLVAFGYQREFNLSIIIPTVLYILTLICLWILDLISIEAVIYARIMVDLLVMIIRLIIAYKNKLIFSSR